MHIAYRLALRDIIFFQNYTFDHSSASVRTRRLATWGGAAVILALIGVMAVISESWPLFAMGVALAAVPAVALLGVLAAWKREGRKVDGR